MTKPLSDLATALLETAEGLHRIGLMDEAVYQKITARHLGPARPASEPMTGEEIRAVREKARMSQAALGRIIGVTPGYMSQLERGTKRATGSTLAMLNVIRRKGLEAVL